MLRKSWLRRVLQTETRLRSQFGRQELLSLSYRIASTQLVVHHKTGQPRNPEARAYFEKLLGDQAALPREKQDRKRRKKAPGWRRRQQSRAVRPLGWDAPPGPGGAAC